MTRAALREHIRLLKSRYARAEDVDARKRHGARIGGLLGVRSTCGSAVSPSLRLPVAKALAERTALALRTAVQEGVVPGGGVAFLNCAARLRERLHAVEEPHHQAACRILIEALSEPARVIFHNAGYEPGEIFGTLAHSGPNTVFDAMGRRFLDVREGSVLDSAPVLKACLRNAISTAALALTIDSVVHLSHPEMVGKPE
ncbi:MAG: hypothetical protein IPK19_04725 [Chloroflexi bacterium]|nr:hypothetical protein [Chloroflexota bacterium]